MGSFLWLERTIRYLKHHPGETPSYVGAGLLLLVAAALVVAAHRPYFAFVGRSLLRNPLRTAITSAGVMFFVFVVTLVWSFLVVLDVIMEEKSKDLKAIVTERWQVPSMMPFAYAASLEEGAASHPGDVRPDESMTWQFYGGTTDPGKNTRDSMVFLFALDPRKIRTMMDELDVLDPALVERMAPNKKGILLGRERLRALNKQVGERITLTGLNYKGIDLEFEVVGLLPEGRYNMSGMMNRDYLNDALEAYPKTHGGARHPLAQKSLNLVWLRVPDRRAFDRVAEQIMSSSLYTSPAVKCETAASGIASWLDAYRDLLWGLKWLLVPAIVATMTMVIAIAISISVRQRRTEVAVLKVLGFGPGRILGLVLGEALLIGGGSGLVSGGLSYALVHHLLGGIKFPVAFFPVFDIYADALWWGLVLGCVTALIGSIGPAWSARRVKVSEVFAKVT